MTVRDLKRATWTIVATIALATALIMLTIKYSSPNEQCRFLLDRVTSGNASDEEFAQWEELGCGSMDI